MTQDPAVRHDPMASLRQPNFLVYSLGRVSSGMAMTMLNAAIAWQVYDISQSTFQLAMIGLARFLPSLGLTLVGGAVADGHDRKRIVMVAQLVPLLTSLTLFLVTRADSVALPLIYGLVLFVAVASSFENPARQAFLPQVVTPETFPNAIVVSSTLQSFAFVTGPAVGGLLIGTTGVAGAYAAHMALIAVAIVSLAFVTLREQHAPRRAVSLSAIREGVHFVRHRQVLLGSMTLDMFAVIFGGATALLPVYAKDILHVGGLGYGILFASLDAGALIMATALIFLPPIRNAGRSLLITVALFGLGTMVFGLSRNIYLSIATYMFIGMADQVSVVLRNTTVQLSTPDDLRGRVSSVNSLFIGASNQLGAVESGLVASVTNATFAVVTGGAGCMAVVAAVWAKMPDLRNYQIRPHTVASEAEAEPVPKEGAPAAG